MFTTFVNSMSHLSTKLTPQDIPPLVVSSTLVGLTNLSLGGFVLSSDLMCLWRKVGLVLYFLFECHHGFVSFDLNDGILKTWIFKSYN